MDFSNFFLEASLVINENWPASEYWRRKEKLSDVWLISPRLLLCLFVSIFFLPSPIQPHVNHSSHLYTHSSSQPSFMAFICFPKPLLLLIKVIAASETLLSSSLYLDVLLARRHLPHPQKHPSTSPPKAVRQLFSVQLHSFKTLHIIFPLYAQVQNVVLSPPY